MRQLAIAFGIGLIVALPGRPDETSRWVGKTILITTRDAIPILGNNDKPVGTVATLEATVLEVKGSRLRIRDGRGQEGWVESSKFVPLPESVAFFTRRIEAEPNRANHHYDRAQAYRFLQEYDKALPDFAKAIELSPKNSTFYNERGLVWEKKQEYDRAVADFTKAIELDPTHSANHAFRGVYYARRNDHTKAITDFDTALKLDPNYAGIFLWRGVSHKKVKAFDRALADYNEACRINPKFAAAFNNRAWLLATCNDDRIRDGKKAMQSATRACDLADWKNVDYLESYAAACAEAGKFDEAVNWAEKAIALAPEADRAGMRSRLEAYRAKKPIRE